MDNMTPRITTIADEPQTEAGRQRAETLRQLHHERRIPGWWFAKALREVDRPIPSTQLRREQLGAWVMVWNRPRWSDAGPMSEVAFDALVEEYDTLEERNQYFEDRRKEREAAEAEAQRQREVEDAARREQEAEQLKAELRCTYLALPGTTAADFEREFPQLLADHRRREMERLEREGDAATQAMRRTIWAAMNGTD